ncbi:glycosyltransferase, partial [bacterium]|nr:glycosyltransferase [bacterium]
MSWLEGNQPSPVRSRDPRYHPDSPAVTITSMRIALIETHAVPGMWKYDLGLARALEALGDEVVVYSAACFPEGEETRGGVWRGFPDLRIQPNLLVKGLRYTAATFRMLSELRGGGFDVVHWQHFNVLPPLETYTARAL